MGIRFSALAIVMLIAACGGDGASSTTVAPTFAVSGYAHAGPVCPVETTPPDPSCEDRPLGGAVVRVLDSDGAVVAEATTAVDGTFTVQLPAGDYTVVAQPVEGLLGTPAAIEITVVVEVSDVDLAYDTGIR
ncbi:MAG: carboxypeptidase-like regulatory domain-containing protein [Acidimicrobiia bacterium]